MRLLRRLRLLLTSESGQVIPFAAVIMVSMLGIVGIVVDFGNVYICHRELQQASDAAALAGAIMIPTSGSAYAVQQNAINYSATINGQNAYKNLPNVSMVSGYPVLKCLSSMQAVGISCVGLLPYNAIQVVQQAAVPMYFGKLFGKPTMTITATSTAAKGGASSRPYNVAILLDTTLSMNFYDADCGATQMACSLTGVRELLALMDPCGRSTSTCNIVAGNSANPVVRVSLFTWPQVTTSTVGLDSACGSSTPNATEYTFPPAGAGAYSPTGSTYQIVPFQSDYRIADTATVLNSASQLAIAAGGATSCSSGMGVPNGAGYFGTYIAATIYAAQSALVQQRAANPGTENVMIVLSDGDSNAPHNNPYYGNTIMGPGSTASGIYPSWNGECGQAISAAKFASGQGTTVYTVAYGSPASGCSTDVNAGLYPNVSPCDTLAYMASNSWNFFSDYRQTGSGSTCVAAQTVVSLSDIFLQIAGDLTVARLIPNNTT